MKKSYRIVTRKNSQGLADYLAQNGQLSLPMVELIEASRMAIDELIDILGRASMEAVLQLSARSVAGEKQQGRPGKQIVWYGTQPGRVRLSERQVRVRKPRLRKKGQGRGGEVEIPAYEAINRNGELGSRMLEILMCNVSTRHYSRMIPQMADTVGVSKSSVSRQFIEQSGQQLEQLDEHHVICAVGVDSEGQKHVLGLREGASENAATATSLLEDLVERGLDSGRRYLFVIDGSRALRCAIDKVFGKGSPVQRCRRHKIRNVCDRLPDDLAEQVKSAMQAAYRLPWEEGRVRLRKQAEWLEGLHPDAAASLREGLEETFTINRLELSSSLRLCLASTNLIESPHSGVRMRTRRVSRWKDSQMVLRWVASAFLETEKNFRRIQGYQDLWMLKTKLRDEVSMDAKRKVAQDRAQPEPPFTFN